MRGNKLCAIYDAYYDKDGVWVSIACLDPHCQHCSKRPVKHSKHCKCEGEDASKE